MVIQSANFVASYPRVSMCPDTHQPEFAFIGRSNVGKSSLINMLTGKKGLAKVSGTPGKTRLLNFFLINNNWHLVDLPGYGFAKVSKKEQDNLTTMINGYLMKRQQLALAFVLIDSNLPPKSIDLDFINKLGEFEIPFAILFTKSDRIGKALLEKHVQMFLDALSEHWENLPLHFITSSQYRIGREEVLQYIEDIMAG
ncbi:MAG: YihA family ribosome biogenesis GTP-binding protein [Saprospiraceae bacterium]|nr:YihA family ribosome biogenesis GTP-binding protein [Saprospiraceae bacterium]